MLTDDEKAEIISALQRVERKQAACLDALLIVQRRRGWVSDEGVADVASALGLTAEEVDGVATFFELVYRKPVGRHVILVCDSVSCWLLDYETLLDHLKSRLGVEVGGTTADGRFTLLPICCLGDCDHAPVMMLDDTLIGNVTTEIIDQLLASEE
jgi:NADH-quinone oxidoreductase subunit E